MWPLVRRLLFLFDAERAHGLGALVLRLLGASPALAGWLRRRLTPDAPSLHVDCFGLRFPSPVGLAAGFDKGHGLAAGLFALGFGAVEIGTLTPRPQPGNDRPRLFRLPGARALVNRMGFNNAGAVAAKERYARLAFRPAPLGVNLGKNKATPSEQAADDYLAAFRALAEVGDYFVVNVSSPNTPGLRDLQAPAALRAILRPLVAEAKARGGRPILLKLAPDLPDEDIDELAALARAEGLAGLVLANTTIGRPGLEGEPNAKEGGGLSGPPLKARMLALVARVHATHGDALPIVAAGGIESADDVRAALAAGASLVQLYTAFVYGGPLLPSRLHRALAAEGVGLRARAS